MVESTESTVATWLDGLFPRPGGPAFELYERARKLNWSHTIVPGCRADRAAFVALAPARRLMLQRNLLFFAYADGAVIDLLTDAVTDLVYGAEEPWLPGLDLYGARLFLRYHMDIEGVHALVYRQLLEGVVGLSEHAALDEVLALPGVMRKLETMRRIGQTSDAGELVFTWMLAEGLFLQETFACILYFSPRDFPAVVDANRRIRDDENLHAEFAALLFRSLRRQPPPARLRAIVEEVVAVCDAYVADVLPDTLADMSPAMLRQYARFRADVLLGRVGQPPAYGVENPLPWLEMNGQLSVPNMHETRPTAYVVATSRPATGRLLSLDDC